MGILVFLTLLISQDVIVLGTTLGLKTIFLGRCAQYQALSNGNRTIPLAKDVNCVQMWQLLTKVFKRNITCEITEESYKDYFSNVTYRNKLVDKVFYVFLQFIYITVSWTFGHMNMCYSIDKAS